MLIASLIRYDRLVEERTEARLIIGYVDAEEARALETALEQRRVDEVTHELRREQRRRGAQLGARSKSPPGSLPVSQPGSRPSSRLGSTAPNSAPGSRAGSRPPSGRLSAAAGLGAVFCAAWAVGLAGDAPNTALHPFGPHRSKGGGGDAPNTAPNTAHSTTSSTASSRRRLLRFAVSF